MVGPAIEGKHLGVRTEIVETVFDHEPEPASLEGFECLAEFLTSEGLAVDDDGVGPSTGLVVVPHEAARHFLGGQGPPGSVRGGGQVDAAGNGGVGRPRWSPADGRGSPVDS